MFGSERERGLWDVLPFSSMCQCTLVNEIKSSSPFSFRTISVRWAKGCQYGLVDLVHVASGSGSSRLTPWTRIADIEVVAALLRRKFCARLSGDSTSKLRLLSVEAAILASIARDRLAFFVGYFLFALGVIQRQLDGTTSISLSQLWQVAVRLPPFFDCDLLTNRYETYRHDCTCTQIPLAARYANCSCRGSTKTYRECLISEDVSSL